MDYVKDSVDGATHTVYWRWVFDNTMSATAGGHAGQTNETDTALGVQAAASAKPNATVTIPSITVTAEIVVSQVN